MTTIVSHFRIAGWHQTVAVVLNLLAHIGMLVEKLLVLVWVHPGRSRRNGFSIDLGIMLDPSKIPR